MPRLSFVRVFAFAVVASLALGCASTDEASEDDANLPDVTSFEGLGSNYEPYTSNLVAKVGDEAVAYLIRYDPLPEFSSLARKISTGTVIVQNDQLETVGYVSPNGKTVRLTPGETQNSFFADPLFNDASLERSVQALIGLDEDARVRIEPLKSSG